MANGEIKTSSLEAAAVASQVTAGLNGYCSFSVGSISAYAPVAGGLDHDAAGEELAASMSSYASLVTSDANAIVGVGSAFDGADALIARGLLGIGGA